MKRFVFLPLVVAACVTPPAPVPTPTPTPSPVPAPAERPRPDACFEGRTGAVFLRWKAIEGGAFELEESTVSEPALASTARCFGDELMAAAQDRGGKGAGQGTFRFSRSAAGFEAVAALRADSKEIPESSALLSSRREFVKACVPAGRTVWLLVESSGRVSDVGVSGVAQSDEASRCVLRAFGDAVVEGFGGPPTELEWSPHAD